MSNYVSVWGDATHAGSGQGFFSSLTCRNHWPVNIPTQPAESAPRIQVQAEGGFGVGNTVEPLFGDKKGDTAPDAGGAPFTPVSGSAPAKPSGGAMTEIAHMKHSHANTILQKTDGSFWGWGYDLYGDVGLGRVFSTAAEPDYAYRSEYETATPFRLVALENAIAALGTTATAIATEGAPHTLIKLANGMVLAFGGNLEGQLGNGFEGEQAVTLHPPRTKGSLTEKEWAEYQAERHREVVEYYEKNLWRPAGRFPKLVQTAGPANEPIIGVNVLEHVTMVSVGSQMSLFVTEPEAGHQKLYYAGQSIGAKVAYATEDTRLAKLRGGTVGTPSGPKITAIACGQNASLLLLSDGTVCTVGGGAGGLAGTGVERTTNEVLTGGGEFVSEVTLPEKAVAIAVSFYHALVVLEKGRVMAWGSNKEGAVGNGENLLSAPVKGTIVTTPQFVIDGVEAGSGKPPSATFGKELGSGSVKVVGIAAGGEEQHGNATIGGNTSIALMSDGTVRTWGFGNTGIIGNLLREDSSVAREPGRVAVAGSEPNLTVTNATAVFASVSTCAVLRTGSLPETPLTISAAGGTGEILVTWQPSTPVPELAEIKWLIEWSKVDAETISSHFVSAGEPGEPLSYLITGLVPGGHYEIQVNGRFTPEKYTIESATPVGGGKQEVVLKLAPLGEKQREEPGWEFAYQRQQEYHPLPTQAEAKTKQSKSEGAEGPAEKDVWRQSRELKGRTPTFPIPPLTVVSESFYKEEVLGEAFINELKALAGVNAEKTTRTGTAGKYVYHLIKEDVLTGEVLHYALTTTGGAKGTGLNTVEGTWESLYGVRYLADVVASSREEVEASVIPPTIAVFRHHASHATMPAMKPRRGMLKLKRQLAHMTAKTRRTTITTPKRKAQMPDRPRRALLESSKRSAEFYGS